jgi:hypothetical protein
MFAIRSVKECISLLLLSDMFYEKWKEILLLWEHGKILDMYYKLPSRPQPMGKSAFNCLMGFKEIHMVKHVHGLKANGILWQDWHATGGNPHLLIMTEFCYNIKKRRVIQNEIMVFH